MCVGQPPAPPQPQVTCAHTHNQLHHKRLWAASHPPTHSTQPDPPPLSLAFPPYLFLSVSCSLLPTLIHKMAASQLQLLAWNLRMRGQGQQRARGEIAVYSTCAPPFPSPCVPIPIRGSKICCPNPPPPVCQPSTSLSLQNKPDTLTGWEGNWIVGPVGGRQAQSREVGRNNTGGSSPEAIRRGMGTFSSSIPGSHRLGFCRFTTSQTHARLWHVFSTVQKCLSYYA